jgi:hypothetical protein
MGAENSRIYSSEGIKINGFKFTSPQRINYIMCEYSADGNNASIIEYALGDKKRICALKSIIQTPILCDSFVVRSALRKPLQVFEAGYIISI